MSALKSGAAYEIGCPAGAGREGNCAIAAAGTISGNAIHAAPLLRHGEPRLLILISLPLLSGGFPHRPEVADSPEPADVILFCRMLSVPSNGEVNGDRGFDLVDTTQHGNLTLDVTGHVSELKPSELLCCNADPRKSEGIGA